MASWNFRRVCALLVASAFFSVVLWSVPWLFHVWVKRELVINGWRDARLDVSTATSTLPRRPFRYVKYADGWDSLVVAGYRFTAKDASDLSWAKHVRSIVFHGCTFEDNALGLLAALPELTELSFVHFDPKSPAIGELARLRNVRKLLFDGEKLDGFPFCAIAEIRTLEELGFPGSTMAAKDAECLGGLSNLKVLNLNGARVDAAMVEIINRIPQLQVVYLVDSPLWWQLARRSGRVQIRPGVRVIPE